jgi:hypothetical protein
MATIEVLKIEKQDSSKVRVSIEARSGRGDARARAAAAG